jgi:hypothetical protein
MTFSADRFSGSSHIYMCVCVYIYIYIYKGKFVVIIGVTSLFHARPIQLKPESEHLKKRHDRVALRKYAYVHSCMHARQQLTAVRKPRVINGSCDDK